MGTRTEEYLSDQLSVAIITDQCDQFICISYYVSPVFL